MKITKQRATYLAVLGLGVVALIVDRFALAPADASAASASQYAITPNPGEGEPNPGRETAPATSAAPPLAQKLLQANGGWPSQVRDAFRPSVEWIPPPPPEAVEAVVDDEIKAFTTTHMLTAIQGHSTQFPVVIVNGKVLRLGDTADAWTLSEVRAFSVLFTRNGLMAELKLKDASGVAGAVTRDPSIAPNEMGPPGPSRP